MSTKESAAGAPSPGRDPLEELRSLSIEREPVRTRARNGHRRVPWGWIVALLLMVGAVLLGYRPAQRWYAEKTTPPPETLVVVRTGGPQTLLAASGYVNADAVVTVGATISGRLRAVLVDKGDGVKRGQLLAQLEDDELRAELALQRAALSRDGRNLARQETLSRSSATTQEQLDNARSQLESSRAQVALTDAKLKQTRIVSPIDGKVLERLVEPGVIVTPANGAIFKLADMRKTVVEVDVNETDLGKLHTGEPVDVTLDAYPNHPYRATLREFSQVADRAKATVQVKVWLDGPDDNVRPGMSAKVIFRPVGAKEPAEPGKILIPGRALLAGGHAVFVVRGGVIERREIETRPGTEPDLVEVVRGLAEGDIVIVSGQDRMMPGQHIQTKSE